MKHSLAKSLHSYLLDYYMVEDYNDEKYNISREQLLAAQRSHHIFKTDPLLKAISLFKQFLLGRNRIKFKSI